MRHGATQPHLLDDGHEHLETYKRPGDLSKYIFLMLELPPSLICPVALTLNDRVTMACSYDIDAGEDVVLLLC